MYRLRPVAACLAHRNYSLAVHGYHRVISTLGQPAAAARRPVPLVSSGVYRHPACHRGHRNVHTEPEPPADKLEGSAPLETRQPRSLHKNTERDLWEAVRIVRDDNCSDVVTIDVRARSSTCDFFVIATCRAKRHMQAVADELQQKFKDRRRKGERLAVEGDSESQWMVVDMSDIQVHLLEAPTRRRLELEKLWTLGADDDQLKELLDARPDFYI